MPTPLRVPPALPWIRDQSELPAPLPTRAQIEAATTEFPNIYGPDNRRIVLVDDVFVVKYGHIMWENEGHALLVVESYPDIRAPILYAMYREDDILYIVMEYIPGRPLSNVWQDLSEDDKLFVVGQLRIACDTLRSIPAPGYYGGALGGPLRHSFFFSLEKDPRIMGPFSKEEDLCRALAIKSAKNWELAKQHGWMSDFFARHVPAVLKGHESVFTHADFQRKNILVQEEECSDTAGTNPSRRPKLKAILDWESAGWYPSYWDYASCFAYFAWLDDWPENVEKILDPHVNEAVLLRMIRQDLDS